MEDFRDGRLSAEDRLDLMELYARYAWAMDSGDLEAFEKTVTPEVKLFGKGQNFEGLAAVRAWEEGFLRDPGFPGTQHFYTNFIMRGDGETAEVRAYVARLYGMPGTSNCQLLWLGYYIDTCVKRNGMWFIHIKCPHAADGMRQQEFSQSDFPAGRPSLYDRGGEPR
jgi:hypothetical protein